MMNDHLGHEITKAPKKTIWFSCFRVFVATLVATSMIVLAMPLGHAQEPAPPQAVLQQYCFTCHNERAKIGGLALDSKELAHVGADAETWEKVVRKRRTGMMPPSGVRRPERGVLDGLAAELETRLDKAAVPGVSIEVPALHRLNRPDFQRDPRPAAIDVMKARYRPTPERQVR